MYWKKLVKPTSQNDQGGPDGVLPNVDVRAFFETSQQVLGPYNINGHVHGKGMSRKDCHCQHDFAYLRSTEKTPHL